MASLKSVIRETKRTLKCSGIWAGMMTVRYFDGKTYSWVGVSQQKSFYDKVCSAYHFLLSI